MLALMVDYRMTTYMYMYMYMHMHTPLTNNCSTCRINMCTSQISRQLG